MRTTVRFLGLVVIAGLVSCAPRGENQSVDQVFKNQHEKFTSQVKQVQLKDNVAGTLQSLTTSLDHLAAANDTSAIASTAGTVSENLSALILNAGYTSRPAITELTNQYRALSESKETESNKAAVKLLIARTYSALASELETTKFAL